MAAVITTTSMTSTSEIERVRAHLAVKMIQAARKAGFDVIALDLKSEASFLSEVERVGACVVPQVGCGMGVSRREAISAASKIFPDAGAYVWMEPEKVALVPDLPAAVRIVTENGKDMAFFNRKSLDSYPPEQAHAYAMVRLAAQYILGNDLDFMFGPLVIGKHVLHYFLEYGGEHGDKWDSIHVPKLRAIKAGASYEVIEIDYQHPPEQTHIETGNMDLFLKRIEQIQVVASAMNKEWCV